MRRRLALVAVALVVAGGVAGVGHASDGVIDHDGDRLRLHNGPGQTVSGETDLSEGTTVRVTISSETPEDPFLFDEEATVDADGAFEVRFDASTVDARSEATATVRVDSGDRRGEELASVPVAFDPCNGQCPTPSDGSNDGDGTPGLTSPVPVDRGETATVPIEFGNESVVTLAVGRNGTDDRVVATVRDGEGDGSAIVLVDTAASGDGRLLAARSDADELTVTGDDTAFDAPLAPGEHPIELSAGPNASDPVATGVLDVAPEEGAGVAFEQAYRTAYTGEVAQFDVAVGAGSEVTFSVGEEGSVYHATATLRDGDGDGRIPVRFDTAVGTSDDPFRAVDDADEVADVAVHRNDVDAALPPDQYDLTLETGGPDGDRYIGTLSVDAVPASETGTESDAATDASSPANGADDVNRTDGSLFGSVGTTAVGGLVGALAALGVGLRVVRG